MKNCSNQKKWTSDKKHKRAQEIVLLGTNGTKTKQH